jgi:chromosome partitioning protein
VRKGIIVSVLNHKGGCLKTTVTTNLGAGLARAGKRVLLIDLDAQQNLTMGLIGQVLPEPGVRSLYDALLDEASFDELIRPTSTPGLDIIPVTEEFVAADLSLVSAVGRELILRSCLQKTERIMDYDYVLLDNSPSISLVVMNALVASDYFVVPCSAEYFPMVGLTLLSNTIARMGKLVPHLHPLGVIVTLFSRNESICRKIDSVLRTELQGNVFEARVRVNTKGKVAPSKQKTIFQHESNPQGRGTEDFTQLAAEFLERVAQREGLMQTQVVNG